MRYAKLLTLIDMELERLHKAKELLAAFDRSSLTERPKKSRELGMKAAAKKADAMNAPSNSAPATVDSANSDATTGPAPQAGMETSFSAVNRETNVPAAPATNGLIPKRVAPRRRRSSPVRHASTEATALSAPVPERPVFVSAQQVRMDHTQKADDSLPDSPAQEVLDPAVIAKRWLRGLAS